MRRLRRIVAMGGAFRVYGNTTLVAEFNVCVDPDAARIVLDSGIPITLVPLDVTEQCILRPEHLTGAPQPPLAPLPPRPLAPSLLPFVAEVSAGYMRFHEEHDGFVGSYLHDPLAVAVAADPTLVTTRRVTVHVETEGRYTSGMTLADLRDPPRWNDAPNAEVAVTVDAERFLRRFLARMRGETPAA
jgi:purine nucleosidase/pyrimidine-specific ribonucleoside hydrolase